MMHIGFPSVYNWISSMSIKNKEDIKVLENAQTGMKKILNGLTEKSLIKSCKSLLSFLLINKVIFETSTKKI